MWKARAAELANFVEALWRKGEEKVCHCGLLGGAAKEEGRPQNQGKKT